MTTTNLDQAPEKCEPGASEYWPLIPTHLREGLKCYIDERRPTGGFLRAVFENNLRSAVVSADPRSLEALYDLCMFLYNFAPARCYGTPERVAEWLAEGKAVTA